jgi:nucleoside-diphosphate-sugar epimerase
LLDTLFATYDFDVVYHLAALLSTKSERQPRLANRVNVDGTLHLLEMTVSQARQQERDIKFLYPSSIAVTWQRPTPSARSPTWFGSIWSPGTARPPNNEPLLRGKKKVRVLNRRRPPGGASGVEGGGVIGVGEFRS